MRSGMTANPYRVMSSSCTSTGRCGQIMQVAVECGDLPIGELREVVTRLLAHHSQLSSTYCDTGAQQPREGFRVIGSDHPQVGTREFGVDVTLQTRAMAFTTDGTRQITSELGLLTGGRRWRHALRDELGCGLEFSERDTQPSEWTYFDMRRRSRHGGQAL